MHDLVRSVFTLVTAEYLSSHLLWTECITAVCAVW